MAGPNRTKKPPTNERLPRTGRNLLAVIGVDRYQRWPSLSNAVNDALGVRDAFRRLGFEEVVPPLLDTAATRDALQSLVLDDLAAVDKEDSLVVYFAGHGSTSTLSIGGEQVQTGYLVPVDGDLHRAAGWLLLDGWLRDVALSPAKHILVILDACKNGIALEPAIRSRHEAHWPAEYGEPLERLSQRPSRRVIASARADEFALDRGPLPGHSLFTGVLLEGLRGGIGPHGGLVTGSELGRYVQQRVSSYPLSRQTPDFGTLAFDERGELLIPLPAKERVRTSFRTDAMDLPSSKADLAPPIEATAHSPRLAAQPSSRGDDPETANDRGGPSGLEPLGPGDDSGKSLFWNIGFPGNAAVTATHVIIAGVPYALETALQTVRSAHSLSQASVDARDLLSDDIEVPVKFVIDARGAAIRVAGSQDWHGSAASSGLSCGASGTDVFRVDVQASAAGSVAISITLHVRDAITLRETISLHAIAIPGDHPAVTPAEAPPEDSQPGGIEVSPAGIRAVPEAALVLRVEAAERWYRLKLQAGGVDDAATLHTCVTVAELAKEAVLARKQLVALSKRYRAAPTGDGDPFAGLRPADNGEALLEIARIGRRLHALVFGHPDDNVPLDLIRIADLIRGHGQNARVAPRMQIDAETLPFPWGVVYDAAGPLDAVSDVVLSGFWGRRFIIDRTISAVLRSLPPPTLDGAILPCFNPHLDAEESLQVVASQRSFFGGIAGSQVRKAIESGEQLCAYLRDEGISVPSLLYFFCHARAAHEMNDQLFQNMAPADEQAALLLDPRNSKRELSVGDLKKIRKAALKGKPLVFLNACSSAEADQYYQSQFLTLFVSQWQARAFIGSDWRIPTEFADAFARRALHRFLGCDLGTPRLGLGAAFHVTAAEVLDLKNPFPLIYALYGRPELQAA